MSWIKLHIAGCVDDHNYVQADKSQIEAYGECLVRTLYSFIAVIERVSQTDVFFSYGTRCVWDGGRHTYIDRPSLEAGIWERNRNVLVIALINLAATPIPLRGSSGVSHKCQEVRF
jgi:hypothetical protein